MSDDAAAMLLLNAAGHATGDGFRAWYGYTHARHMLEWERYQARGFRFVPLSLHGSIYSPRYSAVMIDPRVLVANELPVEQTHWPYLTAAEMQDVFEDQAQQRFGPVLLTATGPAHNPRFAAVFEPHDITPLTRLALSSGSDDRPGTFQYMNSVARDRGLILSSVTAYGALPAVRLGAIWRPNTTNVEWSAATVLVSSSEHQQRVHAYRSGWCRPALVTPNDDLRYTSLYVGDDVGQWVLRLGMTSASLQAELKRRVDEGYVPTSVQAAGKAGGTRYTALFTKRIEPAPNQFTPTGRVANEEIDNIVLGAMRRWSIRNAAVAIVQRDRLVYARGYNWGHLHWPVAQPTTLFRLASVSKVLTALGIHQLTETESDLRNSTLNSILGLNPHDPAFHTITVDHLLEHTSGIAHQLHWHDVEASGNSPPASRKATDAYIAKQMLEFPPGKQQAYSGAAYYLLGRVLAKKRHRASAFDALREFLFRPLDITRVRPSPVDIPTLPRDEGRCRAPSLELARSVMQQSRPLVPVGYGNANLPKAAATGGMSMSAVDLGRILAFMLSDPETPMSGDTIRRMRLAAVETQEEWTHAGHGWDYAPRATYILRKGGWLRTSRCTSGINNDFGLVMLWGGALNDAGDPVYDTVMDIVMHTGWPQDRDLFPYFDMRPLHQIVR